MHSRLNYVLLCCDPTISMVALQIDFTHTRFVLDAIATRLIPLTYLLDSTDFALDREVARMARSGTVKWEGRSVGLGYPVKWYLERIEYK